MAKLPVSVIEIIGKLEDAKSIVDYLQRKGVAQLIKTDYDGVLFNEFGSTVSQLERQYKETCDALDILNKAVPEKRKLTAMLEGRSPISLNDLLSKNETAEAALSVETEINTLAKRIVDDRVEIQRNNVSLDILRPWISLDIPTNFTGTKTTAAFVGTLPKVYTRESLLTEIARLKPDLDDFDVEIVSAEAQTCLVAFTGRAHRKEAEEALRELEFSFPNDATKHPPKVRFERLTKRNEALEDEIKQAQEKIASFADKRDDLKFLCDYLLVRKDKYEALSRFGMTDSVFVITGYCVEKEALKLKEKIEKRYVAQVDLRAPAEDDENVPVVLKNKQFFAPLENTVAMYSLPSAYDVDPTSVTAIFYYIFFGMMLSDAGYGLILAIAIGIILLKYKNKLEESMKNTLQMYFWCSLSTIFWGAMYGSWWGDWPVTFAKNFLGKDLVIWHALDPLNDMMNVMVLCFGLGLIHLFTGVAINGYNLWRHGKKISALCATIPVYVFILGCAPVFVNLFIPVPENISALAPYGMIGGIVLLVLAGVYESRNLFKGVAKGLYSVYNLISGYLGDILSYSRLLALGLATGIIAQVMNMLGCLPSNVVFRAILFIIVSIVGHVVNIAINLISAYVHTTRLQYVEFYGKFYEGGGKPFRPFGLNTKYYRLRNDVKKVQ